jgi:dienelactone hydrolase
MRWRDLFASASPQRQALGALDYELWEQRVRYPSNSTVTKVFFLATCLLTGCLSALSAQSLEIVPEQILSDESAAVRAVGLQTGEHVAVRAELIDGAGQAWVSEAEFVADPTGTVDTSTQAPLKGSYSEISSAGLIWSMKPMSKHVGAYQPPAELGVQVIKFILIRDGRQVSSVLLKQLMIDEGIRTVKVQGDLHGVLFLPKINERFAGVLVLGGSEGGVPLQKAAWLASRGFAAFALAYFRYEDLPSNLEAIPLEYFGRALRWMMGRQDIQADRIAVVGTSRGGELALQLGSIYPEIKAVAAYVPANTRHPSCCGTSRLSYAWTWEGQALPHVPSRSRPGAEDVMISAIEVERTRGPILLVSGKDDGVWPSSTMANSIVARLNQKHFPYAVEHLDYADAGHRAGRPEIVPTWHGPMRHPVSGKKEDLGGTARGDALSSLDAIPKVLKFLRDSLAVSSSGPVSERK